MVLVPMTELAVLVLSKELLRRAPTADSTTRIRFRIPASRHASAFGGVERVSLDRHKRARARARSINARTDAAIEGAAPKHSSGGAINSHRPGLAYWDERRHRR